MDNAIKINRLDLSGNQRKLLIALIETPQGLATSNFRDLAFSFSGYEIADQLRNKFNLDIEIIKEPIYGCEGLNCEQDKFILHTKVTLRHDRELV